MKPVSVKAHTRRPQPSYDPAKHYELRVNIEVEDDFERNMAAFAAGLTAVEVLSEVALTACCDVKDVV